MESSAFPTADYDDLRAVGNMNLGVVMAGRSLPCG